MPSLCDPEHAPTGDVGAALLLVDSQLRAFQNGVSAPDLPDRELTDRFMRSLDRESAGEVLDGTCTLIYLWMEWLRQVHEAKGQDLPRERHSIRRAHPERDDPYGPPRRHPHHHRSHHRLSYRPKSHPVAQAVRPVDPRRNARPRGDHVSPGQVNQRHRRRPRCRDPHDHRSAFIRPAGRGADRSVLTARVSCSARTRRARQAARSTRPDGTLNDFRLVNDPHGEDFEVAVRDGRSVINEPVVNRRVGRWPADPAVGEQDGRRPAPGRSFGYQGMGMQMDGRSAVAVAAVIVWFGGMRGRHGGWVWCRWQAG